MKEKNIRQLFPLSEQSDHFREFEELRQAATRFAIAVEEVCPVGADRSAAIRKIREAFWTAKAAIETE